MYKSLIFKQTIATVLFLFSTQSNAEFVGEHIHFISKNTAILYQLSDLSGKRCQNGTRLAIVLTADNYSYPRFIPYAYGCWDISEGRVSIVGKSHDGKTNIDISYDASVFKGENVDWSKFIVEKDVPDSEAKLQIAKIERLNNKCRGGSSDNPATMKACDQREKALADLEKSGWCWGPDDAVGADKTWVRCEKARSEFVNELIKDVEENRNYCMGVKRAKVGETADLCDSMDEAVMLLKREGYCMAADDSAKSGIKWVKCH